MKWNWKKSYRSRSNIWTVIIRRKMGESLIEMPVGLEPLAAHNLLTYKFLRKLKE